ncbi:MAG: hypothetical protein SFV21_10765 [Rhodospirillaceae bacterium]|nr:hypothetical protein [Rhodospirillaceae bacterium]
MSVIDFISARRRTAAPSEHAEGAGGSGAATARQAAPTLSPNQFSRHLGQIAEDEMRRSLKRHVDVIDPRELIDLAKILAEMKSKYIAMTLTLAGNRAPPTDPEVEQLRALRVRLQELEAANAEINEAVAQQMVQVRGVALDK